MKQKRTKAVEQRSSLQNGGGYIYIYTSDTDLLSRAQKFKKINSTKIWTITIYQFNSPVSKKTK